MADGVTMNASDVFKGDTLSDGVRVPVMLLGWLACVSGVFGNILIITTLLSQPALRSLHNLYIGNLAIADLVVSAYSMPFWLLDLTTGSQPVAGTAHCVCNSYVLCWGFSASIMTLVTISLNRYLHVCHHPLFVTLFTQQRTLMLCLFTWVLSVFLCLPGVLTLRRNITGYDSKFRICSFTHKESGHYSTWYTSAMLALPSVIVGFTNSAIFSHWRKSRSRLTKWRVRASAPAAGSTLDVTAGAGQTDSGQSLERSTAGLDLERSHEVRRVLLVTPAEQDLNVVVLGGVKPDEDGGNNATARNGSGPKVGSHHELCCSGEGEDGQRISRNSGRSRDQSKERQVNETPVLPSINADLPEGHCASLAVPEPSGDISSDSNCSPQLSPTVCLFNSLHVSPSDTPKTASRPRRKRKDSGRHRLSPADIGLIRSLLTVFVCCVILYLPLAVVNIVNVYRPVSAELGIWTVTCGFLNHSINWIVYGLMNKTFRVGYMRQLLLCCRKDGLRV